jgi:hypothetical protein
MSLLSESGSGYSSRVLHLFTKIMMFNVLSVLILTALPSTASSQLSFVPDEESPFDGFLRVRDKSMEPDDRTLDDVHRQVKSNRGKTGNGGNNGNGNVGSNGNSGNSGNNGNGGSVNIWDTTLQAFSQDSIVPPLIVTEPDPWLVTADIAVYQSTFSNLPSFTTMATTNDPMVTTFYAIGDVPYNNAQAIRLQTQMMNVAPDAEFLIHVGDIRYAGSYSTCTLAQYQAVAKILAKSSKPVFIVPGDNEFNDCPNFSQAWAYWKSTFLNFETKYWVPRFSVTRHPTRPENFYFIHKGTMFVGLNIVGGYVHSATEWRTRLTALETWMESLVNTSKLPTVLFAHAEPTSNHAAFFTKLVAYFNAMNPQTPMLYLNGDLHRYVSTQFLSFVRIRNNDTYSYSIGWFVFDRWAFNSRFLGVNSWYQLTVTGGSSEPPVQVKVNSTADLANIFKYNRGF